MLGNRWGYVTSTRSGQKPAAEGDAAPNLLDSLLVMVVSALLMWRLLLPTEGSVQGDTLWVTLLWPLALVLWGIAQWRAGTWQIRLNWMDGLVWLLVGGHVLSGARVLATVGDKRAALNMLCEWIAVGISFFLVRQVVVDRMDRRNLTLVLAAAAIAFSGLGIWQHFYKYPEMARSFDKLRPKWEQLDRLDAEGPPRDPDARATWEGERNRILMDLHERDIPSNRQSRMMYEQRIKNSSEPFGMFALANTFAGLLACLLVICVGVLVDRWQSGSWMLWFVFALLTAVVAYCLLLTKSRTAYAGLLAGLLAWGFVLARSRAANPRKILWWGSFGLTAVLLLGVAGWATGGVDRLVLSESGKSLRYRLEYWRGTWGVLRESTADLLLGVGPGNFRQHYLRHKLPESSEEVADPHNLIFDAWANGGLTAVTGLAGICLATIALVLMRRRQPGEKYPADETVQQGATSQRTEEAAAPAATTATSNVVINGFVLGGVLGFLGAYISEGAPTESPLPALIAGWGLAVAICSKLFRESELSPGLFGAAAFTLIVHLLGAGGIGMPAITQTLLVLVALGYADDEAAPFRSREGLAIPWGAVVTGGALSVGFLMFTVWPVMSRESWLADGNAALSQRRNPEEAEAAYGRGAAADPWSADPPSRLAGLAFQRSQSARQEAEAERWMEKAILHQQTAIDRDPLSAHNYVSLAEWCLQHGRETKSRPWLERAVQAYREALDRYPNHAETHAALAQTYWVAGNRPEARKAAEKALELHEINVKAGHPDKQLTPDRLQFLHRILDPAVPTPRLSAGISRISESLWTTTRHLVGPNQARRIDQTRRRLKIDVLPDCRIST